MRYKNSIAALERLIGSLFLFWDEVGVTQTLPGKTHECSVSARNFLQRTAAHNGSERKPYKNSLRRLATWYMLLQLDPPGPERHSFLTVLVPLSAWPCGLVEVTCYLSEAVGVELRM
jgi:hypothetical protein